ncbi:MAG: hypothetical protein WAP03_23870 [Methylorubrum rhodinum]|jgi:hypothetical protein|uniref:hypothetical protein n=1 Tax=Methylorubrum rhodinum TaxID=29428 RepID=UPI0010560F74
MSTTSPTIDTAIAAWKSATTAADRELAEEAIEQHVAAETAEGGDYKAATEELLARLRAEAGPLPATEATEEDDDEEDDEDEDGVFEDEDCTIPVDGDDVLPSCFYFRNDGSLYRYQFMQPHNYEYFVYREDSFGHPFWLGCGGVVIDDDVTVEIFLLNRTGVYAD